MLKLLKKKIKKEEILKKIKKGTKLTEKDKATCDYIKKNGLR